MRTASGMLGTQFSFAVTVSPTDRDTADIAKIKAEQKLISRGYILEDTTMVNTLVFPCTIDLAPNGPEEAVVAAFAAASRKLTTTKQVPVTNDHHQMVTIHVQHVGKISCQVQPSMNVGDFKRVILCARLGGGFCLDLIHNCTRLREGALLSDYNIRDGSLISVVPPRQHKGVGSAIALKNRNERIQQTLKPLTTQNLPLNLYPHALKKVSHNLTDVMFEALKETLAPVLVAVNDGESSERKRKRGICSELEVSASKERSEPVAFGKNERSRSRCDDDATTSGRVISLKILDGGNHSSGALLRYSMKKQHLLLILFVYLQALHVQYCLPVQTALYL